MTRLNDMSPEVSSSAEGVAVSAPTIADRPVDDQRQPEVHRVAVDLSDPGARPYVKDPTAVERATEATVLDRLDQLVAAVIQHCGSATRAEVDLQRRLECAQEVLGWFRAALDRDQVTMTAALEAQLAGRPLL